MKKKLLITLTFIVIGLITLLIVFKINNLEEKVVGKYAIYEVESTDPLIFSGVIEAESTGTIYIDSSLGDIKKIHVEDRQGVEKGAALITYENDTIRDEITEAKRTRKRSATDITNIEEDIDLAKKRKNRMMQQLDDVKKELNNFKSDDVEYELKKAELEQGIIQYETSIESEEEALRTLERTLQGYKIDLADIDANIASLEKNIITTVTASSDGTVLLQEKGKADSTTPLIQIISEDVVVIGSVSEFDYHALSPNQEVIVKPASTREEIKGTITSIDKLATANIESSGAMTYQFTVSVEQPIQYGFSVQISLPTDNLVIPESAIIEKDEKEFVYIYEDGKAIERLIEVTEEDGLIIVLKGLEQGNQIIENPDDELVDGQEVTVIE